MSFPEEPIHDAYRLFLQGMLCNSCLPDTDVRELWMKCCDRTQMSLQGGIDEFVLYINQVLEVLKLEVKKIRYDGDGATYWGLVNTAPSSSANDFFEAKAGPPSQPHLKLFQHAVIKVLSAEEGYQVSRGAIETVPEEFKKGFGQEFASRSKIEKLLDDLVELGWLELNESRAQVSLGVRTFLDLGPDSLVAMMLDRFGPDDRAAERARVTCKFCSLPSLKGRECPAPECRQRLHFHCSQRYFRAHRDFVCPVQGCSAVWEHFAIVEAEAGADAAEEENAETDIVNAKKRAKGKAAASSSSGTKAKKARKSRG